MGNKTEDSALLRSHLERHWYKSLRSKDGRCIELFIKAACPNNCAYCYLMQHHDQLYNPKFEDKATILKNLECFIDYYIEQKFRCPIDLFSGEIFMTGLGVDILELLYNKFKNVIPDDRPARFSIPDNMSFIESKELTATIQGYIDRFLDLGIRILFSASVDGKIMDENRNGVKSDEYYSDLIKFMDRNTYVAHPMVSAHNIEKWIKNYDWWQEINPGYNSDILMMLEVRNNDWDEHSIDEYVKFLNYVIDTQFVKCGSNIQKFTARVFGYNSMPSLGYDNVALNAMCDRNGRDGISCGLQGHLCVRLGDLAIVPCHRTAYDRFVAGRFIKNAAGKIVDVEAENVPLFIAVQAYKRSIAPECETCAFKEFCMGQCLGSCFESNGDLFANCESVCDLFRARITFMFLKYDAMGVLDEAMNAPQLSTQTKVAIKQLYEKLQGGLSDGKRFCYGKISNRISDAKAERQYCG